MATVTTTWRRYKIEVIELLSIPEDIYNNLYEQTIKSIESTFNWTLFGLKDASYEERKVWFLDKYKECIELDDHFCILITQDDFPRCLVGGKIVDNYLNLFLLLYGANTAGTKSDLFDIDDAMVTRDLAQSKGCIGTETFVEKDSGLYKRLRTRPLIDGETFIEEFAGNISKNRELYRLRWTLDPNA